MPSARHRRAARPRIPFVSPSTDRTAETADVRAVPEDVDSDADRAGNGDAERWMTPGVAGIGAASFLADVGHEIPEAPAESCRGPPPRGRGGGGAGAFATEPCWAGSPMNRTDAPASPFTAASTTLQPAEFQASAQAAIVVVFPAPARPIAA
jgi:hypothetical protein